MTATFKTKAERDGHVAEYRCLEAAHDELNRELMNLSLESEECEERVRIHELTSRLWKLITTSCHFHLSRCAQSAVPIISIASTHSASTARGGVILRMVVSRTARMPS